MRKIQLFTIALMAIQSLLSCVEGAQEAHLRFDPPVVAMNPTIDDVKFSFSVTATNTSKRRVELSEFRGGCGCITFASPLRELEPGGTVDIDVVFDFKDYTGLQNRTLSVLTRSPDDMELVRNSFRLTGEIPTALKFSSKAAVWLYGENAASKDITVEINPGFDVDGLMLEDAQVNKFISVTAKASEDERSMHISLVPLSTNIEEISPTEKSNLHVPYVVKYKTKSGTTKYERFWALMAKRPSPKANLAPDSPTQE